MSRRSVFIVPGVACVFVCEVGAGCGGSHGYAPPNYQVDDGSGSDGGAGPSATARNAAGAASATGQPGDDGGLGVSPGSSAPTSLVRFANWAPDAPAEGFDVCMLAGDTIEWSGPLLGQGVTFPSVSAYAEVKPGAYELRVVAAGSTTCDKPVASVLALPQLLAKTRWTFALIGDATPIGRDPPGKVVAFADDVKSRSSNADVRFINATPAAAAVDFGSSGLFGGDFTPLAIDVQFGQASSVAPGAATPPDADGYLHLDARSDVTLEARAVGTGTVISTGSNAAWAPSSVTTIALVDGASGGPAPQLLFCRDDGPSRAGLSPCKILAP
jgi:hypothetical protein